MSLESGARLGPYEIVACIGTGGMGEVYRARDTNLARDVAVKTLPDSFADDPDRLARFDREAKTLASLNHSNIAIVHDFLRSARPPALVMELVEGPTLADRLLQGPIPFEEAAPIARQIASALEAAHEHGIVHRDLKPSNVKVRPDGTVKVLDFGLAKLLGPDDAGAPAAALANSPTVTSPAVTGRGVVLGTAAYMSPEQARGRQVDRRTDIWALGCVVFEMLTARPAFPGTDVVETLGRVVHGEPAWTDLPADVPPVMTRFLRRCLEKNPEQRVRDVGDVRLALDGAFEVDRQPAPVGSRGTAWIAAALVLGVAAGAGTMWLSWPTETPAVSRFSHLLPDGQVFTQTVRPLVAIAPDGSSIAYVAGNRLYRRTMGDLDAVPIRGTDGSPSSPFFSPDGQLLGYWDSAAEEIRTIAITGGTPVLLAPATSFYGGSWELDGTIVFGQEDGIWRVPADGGTPEQIVGLEPGERVHGPRMLPDGRTIMFSVIELASMVGDATAWDTARVVAQSLDGGERRELVRGSDARYVPTGHLLYALGNVLFAVGFDAGTLEVRGRPVPVIEGIHRSVRTGGSSGSANYDVSRQATLVYVPVAGPAADVERSLVLVDLEGKATPALDERRDYWRPRFSPDGSRVAVEVLDAAELPQIWIVDLGQRTSVPLTTAGENDFPVWTADGKFVVYSGGGGTGFGIYRQSADGSGEAELLLPSVKEIVPTDIGRAGVLLFSEGPQTADRMIRTLGPGEAAASDFLSTGAMEHMAMFSPDGKWVAYTTNESGRDEIDVRPYPSAPGRGRRVSVGGGAGPVWAPDGSALYYRGASGEIMMVPTTLGSGFTAGRPRALFRFGGVYRVSGNASAFDIHPDGRRFVMVTVADTPVAQPRRIAVVQNWLVELQRLVPVD